jgi:hypothetical protein
MDLPATEERVWVLVAKFSLTVCLLLLFYVVVTSPFSDMLPGNQVFDLSVHLQGGVLYVIHLVL